MRRHERLAREEQNMQSSNDLDLALMPMTDPDFAADPFRYMEEARRKHPWLARAEHGLFIHDYQAIRELMWMDDKLRTANDLIVEITGAKDTRWGHFILNQIIAQNGEAHTRLRAILAPMFTPREANRHRDLMRQMMLDSLDEWAPLDGSKTGAFDFEEFAASFPIKVLASMIGADLEKIPALRSSLEILGLSFSMDRTLAPLFEKAVIELEQFCVDLVAERRGGFSRNADRDLLDGLLVACDNGLTDEELIHLMIFLFIAGYDTSKNVFVLTMKQMIAHPDMYERCAEDMAYCRKVVEESLRMHAPATPPRVAAMDVEYRGVVIPKDTMLFFPCSISGRDPNHFSNVDEMDPLRQEKNRHVVFGIGHHICLGQYIARAQVEEGLHLIAQRIRHPRQTAENGFRAFPGVWGLKSLPIAFEYAEAGA
jgi:cytochrome P450